MLAATVVIGLSRFRIEGDRLVEVGNSLLVMAEALVDRSAQEVGLGVPGIGLHGSACQLERLVELVFFQDIFGLRQGIRVCVEHVAAYPDGDKSEEKDRLVHGGSTSKAIIERAKKRWPVSNPPATAFTDYTTNRP